ncbi:uncharacterized protein VDAG_02004 [Verticillium dahliae VdLs.17]|uniref:Uncharacterized protein n=1 Tax=Verticillium dahliae (strain VdLs.17 / ATCC MYA-4575 / FGSC 10137) TaxID=498257 RepID=G2WWL8_VERDV|nr:uncharacterized protein VDAG_02004 [Verticillium dahliae VdLs.17]EGY19988.1 hypothetical protein VDAG_02004 [Verticillium dahliae VdLs.17]
MPGLDGKDLTRYTEMKWVQVGQPTSTFRSTLLRDPKIEEHPSNGG